MTQFFRPMLSLVLPRKAMPMMNPNLAKDKLKFYNP